MHLPLGNGGGAGHGHVQHVDDKLDASTVTMDNPRMSRRLRS